MMFDIDHFKRVNNLYGHAAGDHVLATVGALCRENVRSVDISGRLGGEEFAVLLPHTNTTGAETVAGHLCMVIEDTPIEFLSKKIFVTASFGVAELTGDDDQFETLLARADQFLYEAKRKRRNRVVSQFSKRNKIKLATV